MSYLILDTETSGFGSKDAVLQIAFQSFSDDGKLVNEGMQYFNHAYEFQISEGAFDKNGLTKEFLAKNGVSGIEIIQNLAGIGVNIDSHTLFVAHNAAFDWRMLTQEWARYGLFQQDKTIKTQVFCTQNDPKIKAFVGATDKNNKPKAPNLAELYRKLFGEEFDGAHDALADVRATARCFFELKRLGIVTI